jgi:hypothetical protein
MNLELMEVYWMEVLSQMDDILLFIDHLGNVDLTLGVLIGTITLWMFVKGFEVFKMACCEMANRSGSEGSCLGWKSAAIGAVPDKHYHELCKVCGKSFRGNVGDGMCECDSEQSWD